MTAKIDELVIRHDASSRRCACGQHPIASVNTDASTEPPAEFTFGDAPAPVDDTPAPTLPTLKPLPHDARTKETDNERALPAWRRPLPGQLARRRR